MTFSNLDKVGSTLGVALLLSLLALPLVSLQPNRIMPGESLKLLDAASLATLAPLLILLALTSLISLFKTAIPTRMLLTLATLITLMYIVGFSASLLLMEANPLARISLNGGFWLAFFWLVLLITDATIKLALGPLSRLALVALIMGSLLLLLASGHWDSLSLLQEYHNQINFWDQAVRHLQLALGSIVPAVLIGIPLGVRCHRSARLKAALFPVLNILQTIPSLAMFGLLMIPLSMLATGYPILAELGIRGIGAAPAVIALFFYSLLPIVSNTALGFDQIDASVRDAATGMGMSHNQRLWQLEFPLALPVILTGLRVVVTMNIGLVAVAALVGGGGFGTYIFQGLGQTATDLVLLGAVPTLILAFLFAMVIDTLIALQRGNKA
ncbi:ABC transporter permease [Oceanisphaera pacifica]|uniref:ABC transporter permease n=1 Tax=Oceanisphaera pacifica TaxID=2818389 RepID=A0ABS3NI98_9GAMM|nr:ABC transporter permease [Oceanisphaera pacifica]MBO1520304.1 ABC transporter permease [Oceanisphaera pacifica]